MAARVLPKLRKDIHQEPIKRGRRFYGCLCHLPDGRRVYLARRKHGEIFRGGNKSIKAAIESGEAAWAMDVDTVLRMIREGVHALGIYVLETHEIYLTDAATWLKHSKIKNYERRGGALQRYLTFEHFRKSDAIVKI